MKLNNTRENKYIARIEKMRARKKKNLIRKVKLGTVFCSLIIAFVFVFTVTVSMGKENRDFSYVKVKTGDTVWSIANRISDNRDVREVVYEIKQLNNCSDMLRPGDKIKVPN